MHGLFNEGIICTDEKKKDSWSIAVLDKHVMDAQVRYIKIHAIGIEYELYVGPALEGYFVCILNYKISFSLRDPLDIEENSKIIEKLMMDESEGISIAYAVAHLMQ